MTKAFTNILGAVAALILSSTVMLAATAPALAPMANMGMTQVAQQNIVTLA